MFSGVGFSLLPGCLLLLKGRNGSGKSSFIKILSGTLKQTHGEVLFDREEGLLYLGHKNAVKPEMTVSENIRFWCRLYDTLALEDAALHYFGMEEYANTLCSELSAGWQRKVALTRLMTVPAAIWLLDEPMAHLDGESQHLVGQLITSKCSSGGIVVMATHDFIDNKNDNLHINISDYCKEYE